MSKKRIISLLSTPMVLIILFFALKFGYINPMIKALDIHIIGGSFITNSNRYVIKVGDKLPISLGNYVVVPAFSKKPELKIVCLDDNNIIKVENNVLIANKKGLSTIGVLNKNRLLRKVNIMVVDPKINNMEIKLSKDLKYVGDKAKIKSFVDIDKYKKLSGAYKLNYSSTKANVLKINGDEIEAIGVGEAKLISKYGRKEVQTSFEIFPRVDSLLADNEYELEVGQNKSINPLISTYPKDKKSIIEYTVSDNPKEEYIDKNTQKTYTERGLETIKGIDVDDSGNINANRPGRYKLLIASGDKKFETIVNVKKESFENIQVNNLQYFSNIKDGKLNIELGWDYNDRIKSYSIYIKSDKDTIFEKYTSLLVDKDNIARGNRISQNIIFDNKIKKIKNYQIYVVGENGEKQTKRSDILNIDSKFSNEYQSVKVKNPRFKINEDDRNVELRWDKEKNGLSYRVYAKIQGSKENNYILLAKNIRNSRAVIKIPEDKSDKKIKYDYYIVAINKYGQISDFSQVAKKLKSEI